jgi:uncharacterized membrane protein YfcA
MSIKNKFKMEITTTTVLILLAIGLFSGMLGGMVGIGGGIVIVPALIYFLGFSQLNAQGTSLALIMFPVGVLGVINYYKQGHIDFNIVFILAVGFVVGSFLGSKFAMNIPQAFVKKSFAMLMIIIAMKMLFFDNKDSRKDKNNQPEMLNQTKTA